jgi:HlyD family secretion protein
MNLQSLRPSVLRWVRQRPVASAVVGLAVIALAVVIFRKSGAPAQAFSFYEVKRGDFLVSIVEGGTLQAVNEVSIRNEVEGTARIIFIVPEGSYVKKGDLLVELDSSSSQDAINLQQINVEKAQFALVQAEQQLAIQKSTVDSEIKAAELKVEFAKSDLKKFAEGEALQTRRNAQIEITNVLEKLKIAEERLQWSERLYKDGFETKGNLDADRLTVSTTKLSLEKAQKALWMVETFDNPKKQRELEAALQATSEDFDRVKLQGDRKLAQCQADVETQKKTLELSQAKLERDKKQLLATKIYAPQDGLVVYGSAEGGGHFSNESMIEEGAVVRNRQELIKLPDVSEYKLKVKIHESHINQVQLGQPAFVVLDSMPDQRFRGEVNKVAPLPDSQSRWGNPDLKVYPTEIVVTDKLPDVKPGVSARAEVVITNLPNVLTVPIQAVTTRKGKPVVFLAGAPQEPVPVTVGLYNTKFIEVTSGLKDGDRVMLAPPFDTKEKDLSGAIMAEGEKPPPGATNGAVRPTARTRNGGDRFSENGAPTGRGEGRSRLNADEGSRRVERGDARGDEEPGGDTPRGERRGRPRGGEFSGSRTNQAEMLKRFDANGDGRLDETELAAMREEFRRQRGSNAPPASRCPTRQGAHTGCNPRNPSSASKASRSATTSAAKPRCAPCAAWTSSWNPVLMSPSWGPPAPSSPPC